MAWKETFSTSPTSLKVSMALAPLQALVYIIGYSTNYWVTAKVTSVNTGSLGGGDSMSGLFNQLGFKVSNGLWGSKMCLLDQCQTSEFGSIPGKRTPDIYMYVFIWIDLHFSVLTSLSVIIQRIDFVIYTISNSIHLLTYYSNIKWYNCRILYNII